MTPRTLQPRHAGHLAFPLLLALLTGCGSSAAVQPPPTIERLGAWVPGPSSTVLHETRSSLHYPTFEIVTDTAAWQRLWRQTWADSQAIPPRPEPDFVLSSVIAFGIGDRVGTGYSVTIDSIVVYSGGPVLFATEVQPTEPCPAGTPTAPVHMVWVIDHPPPMESRVAHVRRPCPP
ncbi:MAG: hypothetical protein U0133_17345 [Gemmatimonadales bacterium]